MTAHLDLNGPLDTLGHVMLSLANLNGAVVPERSKGNSSAVAVLTRELLHLDHLLNQARVQVMDQYWVCKDPSDNTSTGRTTS